MITFLKSGPFKIAKLIVYLSAIPNINKTINFKEDSMKPNTRTLKIILTALMAALCCISTMIIQVPSPTGGYIHLGDGLVLLSGIILGPIYGGLAAGIGSMLADILSGYPHYAIATLIIKALAAVVGSSIYALLTSKKPGKSISIIIAGVFGGIIVTLGYFIFDSILLGSGFAAAVTGVPGNVVQNIFGIIVSTFLFPFLVKSPYLKELILKEARS